MAKVKPSIIEQTGTIGDRVYYTRFGKQFSRSKAKSFNYNKSEAQLIPGIYFLRATHSDGRREVVEFVKASDAKR